ncbi:MAG: hypothetical protein RIT43_111 [Bacteroidota bacterium]
MSERFSSCNIGNMHFHNRDVDRINAISEGNRSMRISTGVQYYPVMGAGLKTFDQLAFHIGLKIRDFRRMLRFQLLKIGFERTIPIYLWISASEKVKIRTVDNKNFH